LRVFLPENTRFVVGKIIVGLFPKVVKSVPIEVVVSVMMNPVPSAAPDRVTTRPSGVVINPKSSLLELFRRLG